MNTQIINGELYIEPKAAIAKHNIMKDVANKLGYDYIDLSKSKRENSFINIFKRIVCFFKIS